MKKTLKSFAAVIIALTIIFGMLSLASCGKNKDSSQSESSSSSSSIDSSEDNPQEKIGYIVENGKSDYSIVISAKSSECISFAAEELKKYIDDASGSDMKIITDDKAKSSGKYISLGDTTLLEAENFGFDYGTLNYDGFFVKTVNNKVFIDGYRDGGVLNGVYDYLEKYVGIKFLTSSYTYIPESSDIVLYKTDYVEVPDFALRDYYAYSTMGDKLFAAHMRLNSKYGDMPEKFGENGANAYYVGDGHTLTSENELLVPYGEFGAAHPDWYCDNGAELCYTNGITDNDEFDSNDTDSLVYNLIEIIKQRILENPGALYFMLGQADNGSWDTSEKSLASIARNGTRGGSLMVFVNIIAEEIDKWLDEENIDQDVIFVTFAYWKTLDAPVKLVDGKYVPVNDKVIARDNVAVKIAHMTCTYHSLYDDSCNNNLQASMLFETWSAVSDTLLVWDYCTNFTNHFFWYPNFNSIAKNLKYYRDFGVIEVMTQGGPHVGNYYQAWLEGYLYSKLMWNADQDVNDLIREFNYYYFGEQSSAAVNEFVDLMFYHYATLDTEDSAFHNELYSNVGFLDFSNYPIGFLERACEIIEDEITSVETRAELSVGEKKQLTLKLEQVLLHPMYMTLYNYDAYYDSSTKKAYAKRVFAICRDLEIEYYGEGASIADLKTQYGVS